MNHIKFLAVPLFAVGLLTLSSAAQAWNGTVVGTIDHVDTVGAAGGAPNNYDVRVVMKNVTNMCTGAAGNFAYINSSDAGFKAIYSQILLAQASNKTVTIYTNLVNNYCQIGYLTVSS